MTTISSRSSPFVRHERGTPAGGRFAEHTHPEAELQLSAPAHESCSQTPRTRAERWQEMCEKTAEHERTYGKLPRNGIKVTKEELSLYKWMNVQRRLDKAGTLPADRASALNARIPGWRETNYGASMGPRVALPLHTDDLDLRGEVFQQRLEEVMAYRLKHRRLPVMNPANPEPHRLAHWLYGQRALLNKGELTSTRKKALDDLYPEWADVRMARWAQTADEVADFKKAHGKLPGDNKVTERERALRVWVKRQKAKESEGKLTEEQVQALNVIDGDWRADRNRLPWENNLTAAMLEYREKGAAPEVDGDTGKWLRTQRSRLSAGDLDDGQIEALDAGVPGWRVVRADVLRANQWNDKAGAVRTQIAKAGRLPRERDRDPAVAKMGVWIRSQRERLSDGLISADQIAELDATIPGWRGKGSGRK